MLNRESFLPKLMSQLNSKLLTGKFLETVEKWARYDGKPFSLGDMDLSVTNKGTFQIKEEDIEVGESLSLVDKITAICKGIGKKVIKIRTFDVTEICDNAVASDYDTFILIAERYENRDSILQKMYPSRLYIYAVNAPGRNIRVDNSDGTNFPTFKRLKADFESKKYTMYNSMLDYSNSKGYELRPFNESTDRICNYSTVYSNLSQLESSETAKMSSKHIKVCKRFSTEKKLLEFKDKCFTKKFKDR
jgi:hypothetical protein